MKLEDQICNLELAKRLKELGVKQESLFTFVQEKADPQYKYLWDEKTKKEFSPQQDFFDSYSAFTGAELGEMLPISFESKRIVGQYQVTWYQAKESRYAQHEADARARMLIYLLENKLMDVPK